MQAEQYETESAPHASAEEAAAMARGGPSRDLVFVKKWVGTKHAVLFRLSNKSVQVRVCAGGGVFLHGVIVMSNACAAAGEIQGRHVCDARRRREDGVHAVRGERARDCA